MLQFGPLFESREDLPEKVQAAAVPQALPASTLAGMPVQTLTLITYTFPGRY